MTVYPQGTLLRSTACLGMHSVCNGEEFEVEDYVLAEEAGGGVAFYWGNRQGGLNNITCRADQVELVKTVEQMRAREVPTAEAVANGLNLLGDHHGLEIDETETDDRGFVTAYGNTHDGLRVAVRLQVHEVFRVDF